MPLPSGSVSTRSSVFVTVPHIDPSSGLPQSLDGCGASAELESVGNVILFRYFELNGEIVAIKLRCQWIDMVVVHKNA